MISSCHIAHKAIPYYDPILYRTIRPVNPNAYKLEYYFSDIFPFANSISVAVVPRREYIPIINPPGKPIASPEKAVKSILDLHSFYLNKMKIQLKTQPTEKHSIEISPWLSIRDEGLDRLKNVVVETPCQIRHLQEMEVSEEEYELVGKGVAKLKRVIDGQVIYLFLSYVFLNSHSTKIENYIP